MNAPSSCQIRKWFENFFQIIRSGRDCTIEELYQPIHRWEKESLNLGGQVTGSLVLSHWFDELWDFNVDATTLNPYISQRSDLVDSHAEGYLKRLKRCFSRTELLALQSFHKTLQFQQETLPTDLSLSEISHDGRWRGVVAAAIRVNRILSSED